MHDSGLVLQFDPEHDDLSHGQWTLPNAPEQNAESLRVDAPVSRSPRSPAADASVKVHDEGQGGDLSDQLLLRMENFERLIGGIIADIAGLDQRTTQNLNFPHTFFAENAGISSDSECSELRSGEDAQVAQ